jgi:hypothetical protein
MATLPTLQNDAQIDQAFTNLGAAALGVGSAGTGDTFLKVDDRTGALTFGQERLPLPPGERHAVHTHNFRHGYIDMQGGQVVDRHVVSMAEHPDRPVPAKGYGTFQGGPRDVSEIVLHNIDQEGQPLTFTAWGKSSANRLRSLLIETKNHRDTPDGRAGYIHPVIIPKSSSYHQSARKLPDGTEIPARTVHHFDYEIVDWLHADGKRLLKQHSSATAEMAAREPAPWDDEGMTEAERDLLGPR